MICNANIHRLSFFEFEFLVKKDAKSNFQLSFSVF